MNQACPNKTISICRIAFKFTGELFLNRKIANLDVPSDRLYITVSCPSRFSLGREPSVDLPNSRESFDAKFVRMAMLAVQANLTDFEFTAEALSQKLAVSRRQFFRKFKSQFNCTPNVFIRQLRLKLAAQLLKESTMTISEVILSVGFCDPKYFRAIFRREYGVLPSQYARQTN